VKYLLILGIVVLLLGGWNLYFFVTEGHLLSLVVFTINMITGVFAISVAVSSDY
jgi:hypothetical protein